MTTSQGALQASLNKLDGMTGIPHPWTYNYATPNDIGPVLVHTNGTIFTERSGFFFPLPF